MSGRLRTLGVAVASIVVVGLAGLVVLLGTGLVGPFARVGLDVQNESRSTQVIEAVSKEEEVVLLSLGIQGIEEKSSTSSFFGVEVPGSDRTAFLRYEFRAKLGIDGQSVKIETIDDESFRVTIPEFTFIGHEFFSEDGKPFKMAVESGGVLSFVTPEIDESEMINQILSDGARAEYIDLNREDLQTQAQVFYSGIIHGVAPAADLEFVFE